MNARQKAKYYKQKYIELLKGEVTPTIVYQQPCLYEVKTAMAVPESFLRDEEAIRKQSAGRVCQELEKFVSDHVEIEVADCEDDHSRNKRVDASFRFWIAENK